MDGFGLICSRRFESNMSFCKQCLCNSIIHRTNCFSTKNVWQVHCEEESHAQVYSIKYCSLFYWGICDNQSGFWIQVMSLRSRVNYSKIYIHSFSHFSTSGWIPVLSTKMAVLFIPFIVLMEVLSFLCCEQHRQKSIYLHGIGVVAQRENK